VHTNGGLDVLESGLALSLALSLAPAHKSSKSSKSSERRSNEQETMVYRSSPQMRKSLVLEKTPSYRVKSTSINTTTKQTSLAAQPFIDKVLPMHSALHAETTVSDLHHFLDFYPDSIEDKDANGNFPLHLALIKGCSLAVIKLLAVEFVWATHAANSDGYLPLHLAILHKASPETLELILQLFPQAAEVDSPHGLPLHVAISQKMDLSIVQMIAQANPCALSSTCVEGNLPLHLCMTGVDLDTMDWLASIKPCVLMTGNSQGHLPLHHAIVNQAPIEVIDLLLDHCPQACKVQDKGGNLPLHLALQHQACKDTLIELLDVYTEACTIENYSFQYPLHLACKYKAPIDVVGMIVQSSSGSTIRDTPVGLLLKKLTAKSSESMTSLQLMAVIGVMNKMKQLSSTNKSVDTNV
jgi:ankyrin repeat protein